MIKAVFLFGLASVVIGCTRPNPIKENATDVAPSQLVSRVTSVLTSTQRSGSLAFEGACAASERISEAFKLSVPRSGDSPVQALRHVFENDPRLSVTEDRMGRIRVVGGNVRTDLLDLRIPSITFQSEDNPRDATAKLLTLPAVSEYMDTHHIHLTNAMGGLAPMPKGAHLDTTLKNMTISEALDRIAETFPGIWIYQECTSSSGVRMIDFTFVEF
jgi:hypothetical protein